MKVKVFFLVIGWFSMVDYSVGVQGTIVALPMLSNNSTHCRDANSSGEFISEMVVASQNHNTVAVHAQLYLHNPGCEDDDCSSCYLKILHSDIEHYLYALDFKACFTDVGCASWLTLCEQEVYGINFQIDNPTFSAVAVFFTPNFHQCFATYPLPMHQQLSQSSPQSYVYHVVHSRHQQQPARLKGFTIQNPYDTDGVLSLLLPGRAIGWDNGETLIPIGNTLTLKCREVIWVEPDLHATEGLSLSLSGTVVSSSTPLNVFTNLAVFRDDKPTWNFEFDSQLAQQMPERRHWGKHYIINPRNSKVVPDEIGSCLVHEVTIVSYTAKNRIVLRNSSHSAELGAPTTVIADEHYEHTLYYNQAQMVEMTYIEVQSTSPIVVLTEAYASTELSLCRDYAVHYSTLVQPVEWHANKQIVVLVHPKENVTYHYLVSIVVPSRSSDPADIFESEQSEHCHGIAVSSYHTSRQQAGDGYTLLTYEREIIKSVATQTRLLLRHSDPNTCIGVTVYAYAENLQYSYSNGYTLGNASADNDTLCSPTAKTNSSRYAVVAASLITLTVMAVALVVSGAVIVKKCIKKRKRKVYDRLFAPRDDEEYMYDIFILCADEDEKFVTDFIERPLNELGYKTMRKNTAPDGLFDLGNTVVSDIDRVIKLCSQVIVVCSANYTKSDASRSHCNIELNYCKELISSCNSRVIPIVLDGTGASDFNEFTQHRVKTADIRSNRKARNMFIRKLERDICIS